MTDSTVHVLVQINQGCLDFFPELRLRRWSRHVGILRFLRAVRRALKPLTSINRAPLNVLKLHYQRINGEITV